MIPKRILDILGTIVGETPQLLPTILFNEGWMLRLVLDSCTRLPSEAHRLALPAGTRWFSEALLPSAFLMETRADKLGESFTHADGVIGHLDVSLRDNALLKVHQQATHFVVTEAKMSSALSPGVKNAAFYNQAARNVACIAEILRRGGRSPDQFHQIGFYVLAPQDAIDEGRFSPEIQRDNIDIIVKKRVQQYDGRKDSWFQEWFTPLLTRIDVDCISWESILAVIESHGDEGAAKLRGFYESCRKYNPRGING
jgi:hypothetical protein